LALTLAGLRTPALAESLPPVELVADGGALTIGRDKASEVLLLQEGGANADEEVVGTEDEGANDGQPSDSDADDGADDVQGAQPGDGDGEGDGEDGQPGEGEGGQPGDDDPVSPAKVSISEVSFVLADQTFTGEALDAIITATYGEETLQEGVDFALSYVGDQTNVGQVTVVIEGMGERFEGQVEKTFSILPKEIVPAMSLSASSFVFDGQTKTPTITVKDGETTLAKGTDYDVALSAGRKAAGTYTATVTLKGNYKGSATESFKITRRSISSAKVTGLANKVYTGKAQTQKLAVSVADRTLKLNRDYTVAYKANKNVGAATVTIKGTGNYSGSLQKKFKITAASIAKAEVTGIVAKTYNGKAQTQKLKVKFGSTTLKANRDYTVAYKKNVNVGTAQLVITGKGNYAKSLSRKFKIAPRSIEKAKVEGIVNKTYNGKELKQKFTVKLGSTTLKANRDYTVTYKKNVNAGTAQVVIKGKGNYNKTVTKKFVIAKRNLGKAKITGVYNQLYTGGAITPRPTLVWGSTYLTLGKDYTLSYKNNKALGTATIVAKGKGNYSGTKSAKFKIYQIAASNFSVGSIGTQSWTGSSIEPSPTITYQGATLVRGRDYTVSYANNRNAGWATMTITGRGSYTGSKTIRYYIEAPTYVVEEPTRVGSTVYVTDTGSKYHAAGCRYLRYSSHPLDVSDAQRLGYSPCSVCRP
jgi:hypothetical protein